MLLSVAKERKAQRKQTAFVDALLQAGLTEREASTDERRAVALVTKREAVT